jgi:membrane protease YdiL (CAAX protease family)
MLRTDRASYWPAAPGAGAPPLRRTATTVGLLLALASPLAIWALAPDDASGFTVAKLARQWAVALALLGVVLFWERLPLASIGLRWPSLADCAWAVGFFALGVLTFIPSSILVSVLGLGTVGTGIERLDGLSVPFRLAIVLTAAVTEEIVFRGYPIERLGALVGSRWLGAGLALAIFAALHTPIWGLGGAVQIGLWTVVVTALYAWRRSLPASMLMHGLNNLWAFIVLPLAFGFTGV